MSKEENHSSKEDFNGESIKQVIVHSYPKTVYFWPTMLLGILFWVISALNSSFNFYTGQKVTDINTLFAIVWLTFLTFSLFVISFDFSADETFTVVATIIVVFLLYVVIRDYYNISLIAFLPSIKNFFLSSGLTISPVFYLYYSIILLVIYVIIVLHHRFYYWIFEPNRIIHHRGVFEREEIYSTQSSKIQTETTDVLERFLFRAGTIIVVDDENQVHRLENVYNASRKDKLIKELFAVMTVETN